MSLKNKLLIITTIAIVMLLGVGFASWTFTTAKTENVNTTTYVTASIESDDVEVYVGETKITQLYIICDAPSGQEGLIAGNGIYWSSKADGSDIITSVTVKGIVNYADLDIDDITTYVGTFKCTSSAVNNTYITISASNVSVDTVATPVSTSQVTTTINLPTVEYVTAKIPTNVSEVEALHTSVASVTPVLTFSFSVKSVA